MRKLLLILFFAAITASAAKIQNMPVALVPLDANAEKLEALILAQSSGIDFLERNEIDKLKRELRLSAASLISNDFAIDFKKIKNVRIFALLSSNNIIIFDAQNGIRLEDSDFTGSLEQRAKTAIERLKLAIKKAKRAQAGKVLYLGFLPLTPINLSVGELKIAKQAERLLQRQMNSKPNMAVLERYHLKLLLDEPNPDTEKLLASSLLIRLAAQKGDTGKLILSSYTSVPGKSDQVDYSEMIIDPGKPLSSQISNFLKVDEKTLSDDRQNEVKTFAAQARFAANHLLHNNAVALAASATALNKQQELLLADVCSIAAYHSWKYWDKVQLDKMDAFLDNLETAVKIVVKHGTDKVYNHHFMQMISKLGYVNQGSFAKMTREQQQRLHAIMEFYFTAWHRNHRYLLKAPEGKNLSVGEKLQYLNNRGKYLNGFSDRLDMAWDYHYFGRYLLPVLPGYIKDMNELIPEIKKFYSIKYENRHDLYGLDKIQLLNQSFLGSFHNRPLAHYRGKDRKILEATIDAFEQSKSIELAQRGARARFAISGKKDHAKFDEETLQRFQACDNLNLEFSESSYGINSDARYIDINTQIRIWDTAVKRFGNYQVLLYNIQANCEKLSYMEARSLYKLLKKRREEYKTDPRVKLSPVQSCNIIDRPLMLLCQKLKKQFPELAENSIKLPESPFAKVIIPCPQYASDRGFKSSLPVYRDGKIYFAVLNTYNGTFLVSMDPDKNFATVEHEKEDKMRLGWYGYIMHPVLTDKYLAVQNGPYVILYPLNGSKAEIIDFSDYYNDSPNGIEAAGDRLFLSYGQWAGVERPGTLLEYNLNTRKTKVLISTLDQNVDWPLKGRKKPFHVYSMAIDPKRKCLLTLFPFPDTRKRYNANQELCYLYGYFWEENKWRRLSKGLPPLRHQGGIPSRIIVEPDGIYFLSSSLYKLDKKGELEILLTVNAKGYTSNVPVPEASRQRYYYTDYSNGVAYSDNALFFIKSRRIFRFSQTFRSHTILADKYVAKLQKVLSIGILKKFKNGKVVE